MGTGPNIHHISLRAHLQTHFQSLPPHTDHYVTSHLHTEKGAVTRREQSTQTGTAFTSSQTPREKVRRRSTDTQSTLTFHTVWEESWGLKDERKQRPQGIPTLAPIHRFLQLAQAFRLVQFYSHRQSLRTFALTRPDTIPLTDLHWSYKEQTQSLHPQKIKKAGG